MKLWCILSAALLTAAPAAGEGTWVSLEAPGPAGTSVTDFVVGADESMWAVVDGTLRMHDGAGEWSVVSGVPAPQLHGGVDRGAIAATLDGLFALTSDGAKALAPLDGSEGCDARIVIDSRGRIFRFDAQRISVLRDGDWEDFDAGLNDVHWKVSVCDFGDTVVFVDGDSHNAIVYDGETFHAEQSLPHMRPPGTGGRFVTNARRAGDRFIFAWTDNRTEFTLVELTGTQLARVDKSFVTRQLTGEVKFIGGFSHPDGSVWLFVERNGERDVMRLGPDAAVTFLGADATLELARGDRFQDRPRHSPEAVAVDADGAIWFGLPEGGTSRINGSETDRFGWQSGLLDADIRWLFPLTGGDLLACSAAPDGHPQRWQSASESAERSPFVEVIDVSQCGPVDPGDGTLWVFGHDHVRRWDGAAWTNVELPFAGREVVRAAALGNQLLIVCADDTAHVVGTEVESFEGVAEALPALTFDGMPRGRGLVGPVPDGRGTTWWAVAGSPLVENSNGVVVQARDIVALLADPDGGPLWAADARSWWRLDGDTAERTPAPRAASALRILGPWSAALPYHPDAPVIGRADHIAVTRAGGQRGFVPIDWTTAAAIAAGEPYERPGALLESPLGDPIAAHATGDGAFWITARRGAAVRGRPGALGVLGGDGLPYNGRSLVAAGVDQQGAAWLEFPAYGSGRPVLMRRTPTERPDFTCAAGAREAEVRSSDPLFEYRIDDGEWNMASPTNGTVALAAAADGRRTVRLALRAVDGHGCASEPTTREADIEINRPVVAWREDPQSIIGTGVLPLEVTWTGSADTRRLQARVDVLAAGRTIVGKWTDLPDSLEFSLDRWRGRTVRLNVRAVEDGVFAGDLLDAEIRVVEDAAPESH